MACVLIDHLAPVRDRFVFTVARSLTFLTLALGTLSMVTGWIFASPLGSFLDDNYHLVSTRCPRPIESTGCGTTMADGELYVVAPVTTSHAQCEAFSPDKPHACIHDYSDDTMFLSYRYNDGQYPHGLYQFHHLFVGHNMEHPVWIMRSTNVGIVMVLIGAVCTPLTHEVRCATALAALVAWMSMGLYFIASNNPSLQAITGAFAYGTALYGVLNVQGWRRWTLLGMVALVSLLCYGPRGDVAFYVFVASLGILILAACRRHLPEIGIASVLSVIGIWCMLGSGQSGHIV